MMQRIIKTVFPLVVLLLLWGCGKTDNRQWVFCDGCSLSVWEGDYSGDGTYYNRANGTNGDKKIPVSVSIELTGEQSLKGSISSKDIIPFEFSGTKTDSDYYFSYAGSTQSVSLNLYKSDSDYKLTGTAKRYHVKNDSVVVDESLSFEVIKKAE